VQRGDPLGAGLNGGPAMAYIWAMEIERGAKIVTGSAAVLPGDAERSFPRNAGIDMLRASVTLLVVLHHTAITYGAIGGWYYREIQPDQSPAGRLLILFCSVNQAWFMGLFFLLAGYFTPGAMARHGLARFARERLVRLGLPLLVYALLIGPATIALVQTAKGRPFGRVLLYLWNHHDVDPGPLWFAWALLIFTAVFLGRRVVRAKSGRMADRPFPSNGVLLVAALATGALAFLLRLVWPVGVNVYALQLGYFASYAVLFAGGCVAAESRWLEMIPPDRARLWLRVAWIALPLFPVIELAAPHVSILSGRAEGGLNLQALAYAFWEPFVAWGIILGLLRAYQRRFSVLGGVGAAFARRAFAIYVIHPPILVSVSLAWRSVAVPALAKFVVTGLVSCILCYIIAGLLLRIRVVAHVI
jgi:surface polysaccharide O-acyltransferase-like enzyme